MMRCSPLFTDVMEQRSSLRTVRDELDLLLAGNGVPSLEGHCSLRHEGVAQC